MTETFPRQRAATRNFQLGTPRSFTITDDGAFVHFLRSAHGRDDVNSLWTLDLSANIERVLADPRVLLADDQDIPEAERSRRERMRETAAGITAYSCDDSGRVIAFALAGQLYVCHVDTGDVVALAVQGPVIDPHVSPDGQHIAWSTGSALRVVSTTGVNERALTPQEPDGITWALADFAAAEELGRQHGFWWAPEGTSLLVARVDETAVDLQWRSDPANPTVAPRQQRYPRAGTTTATVSLHFVDLSGARTEVSCDWTTYEYLVSVRWQRRHEPLITLSSRDQQRFTTFTVNDTALTEVLNQRDAKFIDVVAGQPRWVGDSLAWVGDDATSNTRALFLAGSRLTPEGVQVMSVLGGSDHDVDVVVSYSGTDRIVCRVSADGDIHPVTSQGVASASRTVHTAKGNLQVVSRTTLTSLDRPIVLEIDGKPCHQFDSLAETPTLAPHAIHLQAGPRQLNVAVLFPRDHIMGSKRLPIMMRPYGGPHGAQVLDSALPYCEDQWFADQGFAVVIADGRGTPARGPQWDREVFRDFVGPVLDDQVAALSHVAAHFNNDVDDKRVAIAGWSFGGWLAALAVMERPDVFHAAVAGAPVTEWRWYDTAYTERYLGTPESDTATYDHHSLLTRAAQLERPLMLVHGLADDNVVAAHTLALSSELLAHCKPHTVLPLSGVTHMTPQAVVAENLMLLTAQFLKENLPS